MNSPLFPFASEASARVHASGHSDESQREHSVQRTSVLVVDDETVIADSVTEILNRNGFEATACYGGRAAMQFAAERRPDIMVSDVYMPDVGGIELAREVRTRFPATRIVLFSGNAETNDLLESATRDGYIFELLSKPLHPERLLQVLRSAG